MFLRMIIFNLIVSLVSLLSFKFAKVESTDVMVFVTFSRLC